MEPICTFMENTWNEVNLLTESHRANAQNTQNEFVKLVRIHGMNMFILKIRGTNRYIFKEYMECMKSQISQRI